MYFKGRACDFYGVHDAIRFGRYLDFRRVWVHRPMGGPILYVVAMYGVQRFRFEGILFHVEACYNVFRSEAFTTLSRRDVPPARILSAGDRFPLRHFGVN